MKESVSVQLMGGIGNNLFQIACAYAYSLKHNKELVLVNEKFGTTHNSLETYKNNILRNINFVDKKDFNGFKVYSEPFFNYTEIPFIEGDVLLQGYFQSELYFKEYEKEIRNLFSFPDELANSIKEKYSNLLSHNTCFIHVRRGDYLKFPDNHPVQSINYYMKAIRQMPEDSLFTIFSDDIEFCKSMFPDISEKFTYIKGQNDWEDIMLMSLCNNGIIANSSFSWWGSWLNDSMDKIIAPTQWFGKSINHNTEDLYCENWIKI